MFAFTPVFSVFADTLTRSFRVGITEQERSTAQPLVFNISAEVSGVPKSIKETVDYHAIVIALEALQKEEFVLLEDLACRLADICFTQPACASVDIAIRKVACLPGSHVGIRCRAHRPAR
ncbi:MAG: dihydroneopterin aldolase [Holosporales bacterium]|jgi:dihydroneopterin aldolase